MKKSSLLSNVSINKSVLEQQRDLERMALKNSYGNDIYSYLSGRSDTQNIPTAFLERHEITGRLRAKMIDWMVEVLCSYKCSE